MPQNPCVIATQTVSGQVYIFDYTRHPLKPTNNTCTPDLRLIDGHTAEGYGMAWNPGAKGILATGSEDRRICLWDVGAASKEKRTLGPLHVLQGHTAVVEDVSWNWHNQHQLASVGDDRLLILWDSREAKQTGSVQAHTEEVNCVAFNPGNDFMLATGSSDKTVALWDIRKLSQSLHTLTGHAGDVLQIQWSPHHESILASASGDRRCNVWDLSRIGAEQSAEDAEDGPPELLFVHGGHTNKISDFSWNPNDPWVIASVADDNICQIWQMASHIYEEDEEEGLEDEDHNQMTN